MRIHYLADTRIPSRSTHSLQIMRMCAAFAESGADVTLAHPRTFGRTPEGYRGDPWAFYDVKRIFRLRTLPTYLSPRVERRATLARVAKTVPFAAYALGLLASADPSIVYCRSRIATVVTRSLNRLPRGRSAIRGVFVELHDMPDARFSRVLEDRVAGVVTISGALRQRLLESTRLHESRVVVAPDGVDLDLIEKRRISSVDAKRSLGIAEETPVVVYTGRVNERKGARVLLECASRLATRGVVFVIVGKVYDAAVGAAAEELGGALRITGFVPPSEVPRYLFAADVLVLPSTPDLPYAAFTSPLKLFEYMAARRPIVASDLPVLGEVVEHDVNALIAAAGDADAWTAAIARLLSDHELATRLSDAAYRDVAQYTWNARAAAILRFMGGAIA